MNQQEMKCQDNSLRKSAGEGTAKTHRPKGPGPQIEHCFCLAGTAQSNDLIHGASDMWFEELLAEVKSQEGQ